MGTRTRSKSSPVVLENIVDTGTEGTRVASGTEAQRGTTEGQLRYNTEIDGLEVRNSSAHVVVRSQSGVIAWVTEAGSLLSGHSLNTAITNINLSAESAVGGAVTYAIQSGSLNTGLSLSTGGVISGTPTVAGTSNFTVRATTGSSTLDRAFTINCIQGNYTAEIMVLGGGGSGGYTTGGWVGGGGGSGGIAYHSGLTITPATDYAIVVGAGGSTATSVSEGGANVSDSGSNSTGFGLTGYGGGGGAGYAGSYTHGTAGGSSGGCEGGQHGGTHAVTPTQGTGGTTHYGSANGGGTDGDPYFGGGGGGTGEAGDTDGTSQGGDGTVAFNTWLAATSTGVDVGGTRYIGAGGSAGVPSGAQRAAGDGGGGLGGDNQGGSGAAGVANTGSGGGGRGRYNLGSGTGGAGGSGLVIARYSGAQVSGATGGTVVTSGGYTYHTFTSSGTFRSST